MRECTARLCQFVRVISARGADCVLGVNMFCVLVEGKTRMMC